MPPNNVLHNCGMAMLLAALITIMVISQQRNCMPARTPFKPRRKRERMNNSVNYGTNATDYGVANQISTQSDVSNDHNRSLLMQPYQLKSYMRSPSPYLTTSSSILTSNVPRKLS